MMLKSSDVNTATSLLIVALFVGAVQCQKDGRTNGIGIPTRDSSRRRYNATIGIQRDPLCPVEVMAVTTLKDSWAQLMRDSSTHLGSGIMDLEMEFVGVEDECYDAPVPGELGFKPQYCVITFIFPQIHYPEELKADQMTGMAATLCLPDSCTEDDVYAVFDNFLRRQTLPSQVEVKDVHCRSEVKGSRAGAVSSPPGPAAAGVFAFLTLWSLLVMGATCLDLHWAKQADYEEAVQVAESTKKATSSTPARRGQSSHAIRYTGGSSLSLDFDRPESRPDQLVASSVGVDGSAESDFATIPDPAQLSSASSASTQQSYRAMSMSLLGPPPSRYARGILSGKIPASFFHSSSSFHLGLSSLKTFIRCFSLRRTVSKLLSTECEPSEQRDIACLHGVRVVSLAWIVLVNTVVYQLLFTRNAVRTFKEYHDQSFKYALIGNGHLALETLFAVSGLLVGYSFSGQLVRQNGRMNWVHYVATRYWRIVPLVVIIGGCYIATFSYFTGGGLTIGKAPDQEACYHYGWMNLLLVHNFSPSVCLSWTWFLAVDFQLFLLTPLILWLLHRRPCLAVFLVVSLVTAACIASGVLTKQLGLPVSYLVLPNVQDLGGKGSGQPLPKVDLFTKRYYYTPWAHAGAFLLPLVVGHLLHSRDQRASFRWWTVFTGWTITIATSAAILFGPAKEIAGERTFSQETLALYNSVHPTLWGLCVSWVVVACSTGYGGPVASVLSWSGFKPLSRLTLTTYLIHPIIIQASNACLGSLQFLNESLVFWSFTGVFVCSVAVAVVVTVLIEMPLVALPSWFSSCRVAFRQ